MYAVTKLALAGFDFFLCIILILFSTPALQWMQAETGLTVQTAERDKVLGDLAEKAVAMSTENEQHETKLSDAQRGASELDERVNDIVDRCPDLTELEEGRDELERRLAQAQVDLSRSLRQARFLQAQQNHLERNEEKAEQDRIEAERLARQLVAKQQQLDDIQAKLNEATAEVERVKHARAVLPLDMTPVFDIEQNREPVHVALIDGTLTPVDSPYYSIVPLGDSQRASLSQRGDAVDMALKKGSDFSQRMDKLDTRKQFVFLLVDDSSFETFRTVRAYLQKRKISFGWDPLVSTEILFSNQEGATVPGTNRG